MSRYVVYYITRQNVYRDLAAKWQKWAQHMDLTEEEKKGVALFFKAIARRFGLITEFRELGIL